MEKFSETLTATKSGKLVFSHLPGYARFLLENKLEEYIKESIRVSRELNIHLLKYFDFMSDEQIFELSKTATTEFLTVLIENKLDSYLDKQLQLWRANQLPIITRDQILVEDITQGTQVRKKVFMHFLPYYKPDLEQAIPLINELDFYLLETEARAFKIYLEIENERLDALNQKLKKNEEQLLEAQEIANIGSFEWDLVSGSSFYTAQLVKIFELGEKSNWTEFMQYVHPSDREKVKAAIEKAISDNGIYECEYRYQKGEAEKIIWSRGVVSFSEGRAMNMHGTVMDVSQKHHMVRRLERSEELFQQAQALAHIGNWTWNLKTDKFTWSDELYRIYGLKPQSKEITFPLIASMIHAKDRAEILQQIRNSLETLHAPEYTMRIVLPDGNIKVVREMTEFLIDETGAAYKLIGTSQDITKEYQLQKQLAGEKIMLAQKNEELERMNSELMSFGYIASHDLKEPLRKIRMFSNRIVETDYNSLSDSSKNFFKKIDTSSGRMQRLIDDLLTFSHTYTNKDEFEPVDLNLILEEIKNAYNETAESKTLIIESSKLPVVNGIPFQLQQLFENIIGNSVKYSKPGVPLHIKVNCKVMTGKEIPGALSPEKKYFRINVSDNGIGFEQKYTEKIFEIFQRLHGKEEYSGTGIGLAICRKIVQHHHGVIYAEGKPGEGATFFICLPC